MRIRTSTPRFRHHIGSERTTSGKRKLTDTEIQAVMSRATAKLGELNPADGTQGMLAAQMVGAHTAAMEYLNRALAPEQQVEVVDRKLNRAVRLMRVFTSTPRR